MLEKKYLSCDLCVIGGGIAGLAAAVTEGEYAHDRTRRIKCVTGYQMTNQQFMLVEAASFITGITLAVDGGYTCI